MTATATVTIPYNEFEALQKQKQKAEAEAAQLRNQITQAKIEASDQAVLELANAALTIVRFAVASLPPESTKGWPTSELRAIAERLPAMPDAIADHGELARTFEVFALECERYEQRRQKLDPETLMPR